jgi:hypothetical protein
MSPPVCVLLPVSHYSNGNLSPADKMSNQADQKKDKKNEEEYLGDPSGGNGNP